MTGITALAKIWHDGRLVDWPDARIHVLTHGLHYGYAIFEGIRSFATPRGPAIFRLDEHLDRFLHSARIYQMPLPYSRDELRAACLDLVRANGVAEAYLRPVAFSGYGRMGLDPRGAPIEVAVAMWEWGPYLGPEGVRHGIRARTSSWVRVDTRALPPQAKCAANYANGILAKLEASDAGADEAILLNDRGMVAEGPAENVFKVKHGVVSTPPASSGILRGITRATVIELAQEEGHPFHRTDFSREDMYTADELFLTGTAAGVTPVREIDGRTVGTGAYPITRRLQARYDEIVHGRSPDHGDWRTPVPG